MEELDTYLERICVFQFLYEICSISYKENFCRTIRGHIASPEFRVFITKTRCDLSLRICWVELTFGEGCDKVKTHRLKGRERAKQEVYIAVRDALKVAKDWTTFQRELAKSGVSLRKKYRRGTTIVEGLYFVKGKHKFKASEVAKKRKFSFANIDRILNENKDGRSQTASTSSPAPRPVVAKAPKQERSIASKVIEAGLEIGENLAEGLGGLFKLGPGYDPEQEAMNNEMERRRKKAKRKGRSV